MLKRFVYKVLWVARFKVPSHEIDLQELSKNCNKAKAGGNEEVTGQKYEYSEMRKYTKMTGITARTARIWTHFQGCSYFAT